MGMHIKKISTLINIDTRWPTLFIALFIFLAGAVSAKDNKQAEPEFKFDYYHADYFVNNDFSSTQRFDWSLKILSDQAIARLKSNRVSYSTSIEEVEIIEAYTRKSDGKRIDVPKNNFQMSTNSGKDGNGPVFSDRTTLTVVFPDAAVNDSLVFSYRIKEKQPMFPGHFDVSAWFSRNDAYDDVSVRINVPESAKGQFSARHMKQHISASGGRKIIELQYQNTKPQKSERTNFSVWNQESEPGFAYSNFENYQQIAQAYGTRATPKAKVTKRTQDLADAIVGQEKNPLKQASLLYEWVATNITYAGNCIGVGAVVPHDIDFILDNRMGDCKDHATLLQTLLLAKGIRNNQALINAAGIYKLPSIPSVMAVNHVINYLPDFKLFVDSTSSTTPFGLLPFSVQDKPVLIVDSDLTNLRTPDAKQTNNFQSAQTEATLSADGDIKGHIKIKLFGTVAASDRARFRGLTPEREAMMLKSIFNSGGQIGNGKLNKEDPKGLRDHYSYGIDFDRENYIQAENAGAFSIQTLFPTSLPIASVGSAYTSAPEDVDVVCGSGKSEETFSIKLPDTLEILAIPKSRSFKDDYLEYESTYKIENGFLQVRRAVGVTHNGNTCSPAVMQAAHDIAIKIMKDLRSQVVYRFPDA